MSSYIKAFKHYFDFSTRTSRYDFWMYCLIYFVLVFIGSVIDLSFFTNEDQPMGPITTIITLVNIIPSISLSVRRLHDTDRSGWMIFIALIPLIGSIALLVFYCQQSQAGSNRFGANPYGVGSNDQNFSSYNHNKAPAMDVLPIDELEKINALRKSGAITDIEFEVMKKKLLSKHTSL